jgi:ATP-binding cassette, subfamily C (CFTR/MRP), member 4
MGLNNHFYVQSVSSSQDLMGKGPVEETEIRSEGTVSGEVYGQYLKAGGNYCQLFFMFIIFFLAQLAASGTDYWTSFWYVYFE